MQSLISLNFFIISLILRITLYHKMKKYYFITFTLFLLISLTFAQSPYTNVQMGSSNYGEVSIAINPKNTNQVVGGCNINKYYWSTNGGTSFTQANLSSSSYGVWGDPVIVCDTVGNFYYFHLSNPPSGQGNWIDRIVCQKSTNGGQTWNNPGTYTHLLPPKQQDKQWTAVDFTHGSRGNWMYCTWTQFDIYGSTVSTDSSNILFSRSTNMGDNWSTAVRINKLAGDCIDDDNTVEGAVPCVGPNGEIYVTWAGPKIKNTQFGLFFDKSTDGGVTWLANDIYICDQPGGWAFNVAGTDRSNGLPVTVCDVSNGPYRGTIYVNWTDQRNGATDTDVWLVKSTNGGLNWSSNIRVNNDPPGKDNFLTWIDVDPITGYVYVVFYDRRNYTGLTTDVFLAKSTNGGTTFTNERISASPFTAGVGGFFGDYIDISAYNGHVRPIWMRPQSSSTTYIYTALIDFPVSAGNNNTGTPTSYNLSQNFPNPFNPSTAIKFEVPASDFITMKVYDALGKEVETLVNANLNAGKYEVSWDASNYSTGIYYYSLTTGNGSFKESKKMILAK